MKKETIDELREEARKYPVMLRTCWNCNPAHEHLKECADYVILCFACGRYYFRGVDITEEPE